MTKVMLVKDRNVLGTKWVCNFANNLIEKGENINRFYEDLLKILMQSEKE